MAWSWLQSVSAQHTGGSNFTVTATFTTANLSSGSKLIAVGCYDSTAAATGITCKDASANAFTQLAATTFANRTQCLLFAMDTPAGDVGTKPAITFSGTQAGTNVATLLVMEVSGLATGSTLAAMVDGTPGTKNAKSNTATGSPTYSSTAANEFLLAVYGDDGGPITWTKPTGTTSDTASINTNGNGDIAAAYTNSTNGVEAGSWGLSGTSTGWGIILCAFNLASGGGATFIAPEAVDLNQAVRRASTW